MIYINKLMLLTALLTMSACSNRPIRQQSIYQFSQCDKDIGRKAVDQLVLKAGLERWHETKGPVTLYRKAHFVKNSALAQEPYTDASAQVGIAVCARGDEKYWVVEEWYECPEQTDFCQTPCQASPALPDALALITKSAQSLGCVVAIDQRRGPSFELHRRQDFVEGTCRSIIQSLAPKP